jgi:hypothetical protein
MLTRGTGNATRSSRASPSACTRPRARHATHRFGAARRAAGARKASCRRRATRGGSRRGASPPTALVPARTHTARTSDRERRTWVASTLAAARQDASDEKQCVTCSAQGAVHASSPGSHHRPSHARTEIIARSPVTPPIGFALQHAARITRWQPRAAAVISESNRNPARLVTPTLRALGAKSRKGQPSDSRRAK